MALEQKNYTGFAHNLKAYDGIFIMKYIVDNPLPTDSLPKIVLNGLKLKIPQLFTHDSLISFTFHLSIQSKHILSAIIKIRYSQTSIFHPCWRLHDLDE